MTIEERLSEEESVLMEQLEACTDPGCDQYKAIMDRLKDIQELKLNYRKMDLEETKENVRFSIESDKATNDKRRARLDFWAKNIGVLIGAGLTVFGWHSEKTQIWITKALDKASSAIKFGK